MGHRNNEYESRLIEHLTEREWSEAQILNLAHRIARSALMSCEGVLEVLEYQQRIDESIAAQKQHDEVFGSAPVFRPDQFIVSRRLEEFDD